MSWVRGYRRRCRLVFRAAWAYLRRGDEQLFDLRLAAITAPTPLERFAASVRGMTYMLGVVFMPALRQSLKAAADFQEAMLRVQAAAERGKR